MKAIKKIFEYLFLFLFGGSAYYLIETTWRGYSHWTMFILGGLCFLAIGPLNECLRWDSPIEFQATCGAAIITFLELIVGIVVNLILEWNIWDYSDMPFNFLGQICLPFTLIWFVLSYLIIFLDDLLKWKLFDEEKPHYRSIFKGDY